MAWFLLLLLSFVWGSSFILIKKALISFSPLEVGSGRIVISFLAFLPLLILKRKNIPWHRMKPLLVVGLCGSGFPAFLYAIGQTEIPSAVAGVLNSLTPIFTFILAILVFKQKFYTKQLLGISLGFLGIMLLFFIKENGTVAFSIKHAFLLILATVFYAISANTVSRFLKDVKPLMISVISFTVIGPFALIYLLSTDFIAQSMQSEAFISLVSLLILSLIGTFLANILFFKLVQLTEAVFATTVSFIIPFVALMWGFLDGEAMTLFHLLALILILFGIALIRINQSKAS